jgi:hypothetical protein
MGAVSAYKPIDSAKSGRDHGPFSRHPRARLATICGAFSEMCQFVANGD